jgi:hypothetical protein
MASTLDLAAGMKVLLSGGAKAENTYWQVAGAVSVGAGAHFEGIILGKTSAAFGDGSSINGRILTQTATTHHHRGEVVRQRRARQRRSRAAVAILRKSTVTMPTAVAKLLRRGRPHRQDR